MYVARYYYNDGRPLLGSIGVHTIDGRLSRTNAIAAARHYGVNENKNWFKAPVLATFTLVNARTFRASLDALENPSLPHYPLTAMSSAIINAR